MLGQYNRLLEMMGGLSQPTACAYTQALPTDGANCRDLIRDDLKIILGSYVKRAQTISFVERGFEELGLGHWSMDNHGVHTIVDHVRFVESFSSKQSRRLWFLAFPSPSPFSGLLVSPFILACIPYPTSTCRIYFPALILVPSAHTQSGWGWL